MGIHSYIEPHKYGLRTSLKALLVRLLGKEERFRTFFYDDELPRNQVRELLTEIVVRTGGPRQRDGRYITENRISSWRDINVDKSQGLAPSSGTMITCQGKTAFVERISRALKEEKKRRRQPGKRRTTLATRPTGLWTRT